MAAGIYGSMTLLLAAGCVALQSVQPPRLPWWLAAGTDIGDRIELRQNVTFAGSGLRVCRTLVNKSDQALVLNKIRVGGSNRGQVESRLFDAGGNMHLAEGIGGHGAYLFPIIPAGPEDISPYQVIEQNGVVEDCDEVALPRGQTVQIVSTYRSDLDGDQVPQDFRRGRFVVSRGQVVLSGVCIVHIPDRSVECTDEHRWTAEAPPRD